MVMSGMAYGHYGMILVPAVIYPISLVFSDIEKITETYQVDNTTKMTIEQLKQAIRVMEKKL